MINSLMNNIRIAQVNCFNEERLGAGRGFLVWLVANKDYDFGMTDYQDPDEENRPSKDKMFKGNTIDEALQKASDFLLGLEISDIFNNRKENYTEVGVSLKSISQCKEICNKK